MNLMSFGLAVITLAALTSQGKAQWTTPSTDGTITTNEYGNHGGGLNAEYCPTSNAWYATWDDTNLYIGTVCNNVSEGRVVYIDFNPVSPANGGTNANGSLTGQTYDRTVATLNMRADFVMYFKNSYIEYRFADGSGGRGSATANTLTHATGGFHEEVQVPWSVITGGTRPASFNWLAYAVYDYGASTNGAYDNVPLTNTGGAWNVTGPTTMPQMQHYLISSTGNGTSTKPFASAVPVALSRFSVE